MNIILIPVYNDWKSLNKLLRKINNSCNNKTSILIVDDFSSLPISINKNKLNKISKIEVLKLSENMGSQKAIAFGLNYLHQKKKDFQFVTIMDGDGEDSPEEINRMLSLAKKNKKNIIVSCRKDRNENAFIKFCYKIHLILTAILTGHWMSFGNFSCFFYKNLESVLSDKSIWHAYSASIKKTSKILRVYATRAKRFYGNSQVRLTFLFGHSIRIIGVFYRRVIIFSLIYSSVIYFLDFHYAILLYVIIISIHLIILIVMNKSEIKNITFYDIKKIK